MTTRESIQHVMRKRRRPMTVAEIFEAAYPLTELRAKHPKGVYYSVLYGEARRPDGVVTRTGKGEFRLNPQRRRSSSGRAA